MTKNPHLFDANGVSLLNYDHLVKENERLQKIVDRLKRRLKARGEDVESPRETTIPSVLH